MSKHRKDLFTYTLNNMDYGVTAEDASDEMAEVLQAVKDTGKQGTVTVKLTIKPESLQSGQVSITPEVTSKAPQLPRDKAMLFLTPDNNVQREDPRQKKLEFESVDGGKKADLATAEQGDSKQYAQVQ